MDRLVFIVEGDSEVAFVNQKIIPYLYNFTPPGKCLYINVQKVTTNRKLNKKGGNVGFDYLKNEIRRISAQDNPWITTFLDFFRLPTDFPCFSVDSTKISNIESSMSQEIQYDKFIPYIQRHEFEALLFAQCDGFRNINLEEKQIAAIRQISEQYPNVEDINGGPETSPSKRLEHIFDYRKVLHSQIVLSDINIESIMNRSPKFKSWISSLADVIAKI